MSSIFFGCALFLMLEGLVHMRQTPLRRGFLSNAWGFFFLIVFLHPMMLRDHPCEADPTPLGGFTLVALGITLVLPIPPLWGMYTYCFRDCPREADPISLWDLHLSLQGVFAFVTSGIAHVRQIPPLWEIYTCRFRD